MESMERVIIDRMTLDKITKGKKLIQPSKVIAFGTLYVEGIETSRIFERSTGCPPRYVSTDFGIALSSLQRRLRPLGRSKKSMNSPFCATPQAINPRFQASMPPWILI
jgi:hypothetical protein